VNAASVAADQAYHDALLEPADDTIAALQAEVVRQRSATPRDPCVAETAQSAEYLERAARSLRVYEALRRAGR